MNPLYKKPKAMSIFKTVLAVWFTVTTVMPACAGAWEGTHPPRLT